MTLSKSDYLLYLKNPAWLWLKKHDKTKLPVTDANLQNIFDDGNLFETYAQQLFPGGVRLGFNGYQQYLGLPVRTKLALASGLKTLFQGRLETQGLTCIFDVLDRVGENEYDLYEIKSSTTAKPEHEYDLAFQLVVLEDAGLKVRHAKVIHVNNQYKRKGSIDIQSLTAITDVTKNVRALIDETKLNIEKALETVAASNPPSMSPRYLRMGPMDEWLKIYKTIYTDLHPESIYHLQGIKAPLVGELEDLGVSLIKDIPNHISLTAKQRFQVESTKTGKQLIDIEKIKEFMNQVVYPLYFFDYETFSSIIPQFDGIKPYQQVPFQYSLHIQEHEGAELTHKEFLHTENSDPCMALLKQLKEDIGRTGTIFVWYEAFEKGRNIELMEMCPDYKGVLENVNNRILDLMIPFSNGWFVDKAFGGSASIKKVLPVLVSEISYKKLAIQEGATAQRLWMECVFEGQKPAEKNQLMQNLLEYCKLDTLAMVQLFKVLQSTI